MFERYTEKARRVIFFSRYEASQFGSPYIETEHVLLGIVRECRDARRLFGAQLPEVSELRKHFESLTPKKADSPPLSVDLPLSNLCKRVLAYAAEEAERMRVRHIGAEHLFLGLLREKNCLAEQFLRERGITLEKAREQIVRDLDIQPESRGRIVEESTAIRGGYVPAKVKQYRCFAWERRQWKSRDLLVDKQTGRVMFYTGQDFDPVRFEITQGGWKRDHCIVCNQLLYESDDPEHGIGYTNGRDWICTTCHDKFFAPPITPLDDLYT